MEEKILRRVALKITIADIISGEYCQATDQSPNFLLTSSGEKVYRVNLMAVILSKEIQGNISTFLLDDGTGKIQLRFFEESEAAKKLQIGEALVLIGKIRAYNKELYLSPEITIKINPLWLKVRSLELRKNKNIGEVAKKAKTEEDKNINIKEKETSEEEIVEEDLSLPIEELPREKIVKLIKELDRGEGVRIEEIITKSFLNDAEQLIEKMLEHGDLFQILPGKIKVL